MECIKPIVTQTFRPGVMTGLGGFGALSSCLSIVIGSRYWSPAQMGWGTKLKLALQLEKHDTIGIDLAAMCVNDIVVTGAEPCSS